MELNNIYGYGHLFGQSAIDGINSYKNDFIGVLMSQPVQIRFDLKSWIKVSFDLKDISFKAVMSDFIDSTDLFISFKDANTLIGYSKVLPKIEGQHKLLFTKKNDVEIYYNIFNIIGVQTKKVNDLYHFIIHRSKSFKDAFKNTNLINVDIETIKKNKYEYYEKLPVCNNKKYEKLYYKALSINKVNTYSKEGNIPCTFTTPDRVPHHHMWLWDSVFHSMAIVNYNKELAKDAIRAVLSSQRKDGFIAHMINPKHISRFTQPPVLSFGVYNIYKKTNDKDFLYECVSKLDAYLTWNKLNRDENNNGLLEWHTKNDKNCRCDESGLDNSPRFDFQSKMDAIDFNSFQANDAYYLSLIYKEINNKELEEKWMNYYLTLKDKINSLMFDNKTNAYFDLLFDGTLTDVLTPASFIPLFANIPTKEMASKMVETLVDKTKLWSTLPLASISVSDPTFSNDMWRGGVWLNLNYFIIKGLLNYGYSDLANTLKEKTLETVNKWYLQTGSIYEFYDPSDKVVPYRCFRKGKYLEIPDYKKSMHSISDYNWSACFTLLFIQEDI